jgi:integrase/recombinase XerD
MSLAEASFTSTAHNEEAKLLDEFLNDCQLRGMSSESIRGYRSNLRIFLAFLNSKNIRVREVDKNALRGFLEYLKSERKVSFKRIENYFSAISSFFEYLNYEGIIDQNPVLSVRKRYLRTYKNGRDNGSQRKLISVYEMAALINSITLNRDKALLTLLAKTGIRRGELINLDLEDINWETQSITLKPAAKRSNRIVFFDDECSRVLRRWISIRERFEPETQALFVGERGRRIYRNTVYVLVTKWAKRLGLHNPESQKIEDHFSPHCFRHWFTTHLRRAGMPREFIKELRGDTRGDAIDIYDRIDREELRKAYLAFIPQLGI